MENDMSKTYRSPDKTFRLDLNGRYEHNKNHAGTTGKVAKKAANKQRRKEGQQTKVTDQ
jgi:hypothetical protein